MRFFGEKKKKPDKAIYNFNSPQAQQERERANFARYMIDQALNQKIKDKYVSLEYKNQAYKIAQSLNNPQLTKKEVLALGYQQVLNSLNLDNTNLDSVFYGQMKDKITPYITPEDRNTYLNRHKSFLRAIINELETKAQQERQQLTERQKLADTVGNRLGRIQHKQNLREKELDQQILAVQKQITKIKTALAQKTAPKPHTPDYDRLETMLEQLRRLKNG